MKRLVTTLSVLALAFFSFGATAAAASAVAPEDGSVLDLARPVFDAIMNGHYWMAAALAVVFLTAATRRYLPDGYGGRFVRSDVGGMLTAFLMAFGGAVANGLAAIGTDAMTAALALTGLKVGLGAIGGFIALHKLATALTGTKWWNAKAPAWLKAGVGFLLMLIGSSAAKKAEAAGDAAVKANPPAGATGSAGTPLEL